jgi:aminoglycoside phosphotransferase (APT) family kinase protein
MATETRTPRAGEALDEAALGAWLREALPDAAGEPVIRQFPGGASNLTYLITVGERDYVLRRPPFGTKAASAHDMEREYRILSALRPVYPYCPQPLAWCGDEDVLGEPFYLMERLSGKILRRELPPDLTLPPAAATALCRNLVDVHLELHRVDFEAAGLASFGKPAGYVGRQVHGWSKRYRAARTDDVPDNEALMEWLAAHMPPDDPSPAVIHNDYKFDNVVLDDEDGALRIVGVLDWEMATLGDPLMDLGCSLAYWIEADDPPPLQLARMMPTQLPGMMTRRELVDYYLEQAGRTGVNFDFYYAFGLFRLAVIVQQIYFRYVRGQTADERFANFGQLCSLMSHRAVAVARGEASI